MKTIRNSTSWWIYKLIHNKLILECARNKCVFILQYGSCAICLVVAIEEVKWNRDLIPQYFVVYEFLDINENGH